MSMRVSIAWSRPLGGGSCWWGGLVMATNCFGIWLLRTSTNREEIVIRREDVGVGTTNRQWSVVCFVKPKKDVTESHESLLRIPFWALLYLSTNEILILLLLALANRLAKWWPVAHERYGWERHYNEVAGSPLIMGTDTTVTTTQLMNHLLSMGLISTFTRQENMPISSWQSMFLFDSSATLTSQTMTRLLK